MDKKAKQKEFNTLVCVLMGLVGWKTTVELQNEAFVSGLIVDVDVRMNIELAEARYMDATGRTIFLDNFHVMGRRVRYVHIPDKFDTMKFLKNKFKLKQQRPRKLKKQLIMEKRTQQTIKRFAREAATSTAVVSKDV